jgi:RNA polymerase sigma-70 factor, ECF subfamily
MMPDSGFNDASDQELVEMAKAHYGVDMRPFETLVRRYQRKVLANCRYLTRSPNDAEDLAQDVFVKAYLGLQRFEGRARFSTWLQRIKINHCLNFNDRHRGKHMVDMEPGREAEVGLAVAPRAPVKLEGLEERRRISGVLDAMSETLRVPLLLRDLDGLSYQEISARLGVGLSAVKMRIKRAREEFRHRYDRSPGGA